MDDSKFWYDLAAQFRALPQTASELVAFRSDGNWAMDCLGSASRWEGDRVLELFCALVRRGAVAAGVPNRVNAVDGWLDLLRDESPHFQMTSPDQQGWIQNPALASEEYCVLRASRAFELENVADQERPGLRRDRYPFGHWLYDHSHKPLEDPKSEWEYWKAYVWHGYNALIDHYDKLGIASSGNWQEKLKFAIGRLSYDLGVLEANYTIDRGLRGDEAVYVYREKAARLVEEVTSTWRAICERLAVTVDDEAKELEDLAKPFQRVGDELHQLVSKLACPEVRREAYPPASIANPKRRNPRYEKIDQALQAIAESRPRTQNVIFQSLDDRRVPTPPAEPFATARGWMAGFRKDERAARTWLSKRWTELHLRPLPRGPKKELIGSLG